MAVLTYDKRDFLNLPYIHCMQQHLRPQTASDLSQLYTAVESTLSSYCPARKTFCFHRSGIPPCFPKRPPVNNGIYVHLSKLYVLLRYYVHFKQKITLYSTNLLYFYLYKKKHLYLTCNFYSWLNRLKNVSTKIPYMILFLKKIRSK